MTLEIMSGALDFFAVWTHRMLTVTWIRYKLLQLIVSIDVVRLLIIVDGVRVEIVARI